MSVIADEQEPRAVPAAETIDGYREHFDVVPGPKLAGTAGEDRHHCRKPSAQRLEAGRANCIEAVFADEISALIIGAAVDRDQNASRGNVREQNGRIAWKPRKAHPKDVDRSAELDRLTPRTFAQQRMPSVGGDDQLCVDCERTVRRLRPNAGHARTRPYEFGRLD